MPFDGSAMLSRTARDAHPLPAPGPPHGDAARRTALMRHLQKTQGNRAVQRMMAPGPGRSAAAARPVAAEVEAPASDIAAAPLPELRSDAAPAAPAPPAPLATPVAVVQRDDKDDAPWWKMAAFGEPLAWKMMSQFAPQLFPIVRKGPAGVADWMQDRAGSAAGAVFDSLMSPVRAISGVGTQLSAQFTPLIAGLQGAAAKIATNDCSPITQAADKIEQTATQFVTPIIEKLQPVVAKVQGFLSAAWDKIGAPIWEWLKEYAGQQWDQVKQLASWIWSFTEPMRSLGQDAWTWIKNQIGIGDGPEGEDGILQWLQGKLESAWAQIKLALEPFNKQIGVVRNALGEVAQVLTGPISQVATLVTQAGKGIAWLGSHLGKGNALVEARSYVEKSLIPPLVDGLQKTGAAATGLASSVAGTLGKVAAGLDAAAAAVGNPVLHFVASAIEWIAGEAHALAGWASQKLGEAAQWLSTAIYRFQTFLHGLAEFLGKVGGVAANVWLLPAFLAGKVWNWIPACIRDPAVDFIVPIILRQIELFEELGRDATAWQKTKAQVTGIVRQVFVDHDLMGAVKAAFALVLRVFNIPEELLGKIAAKAAAAWDVVVKKPLDFIKNTVRSLGHGFKLLWTNIGTHLEHGIEGWLFGELAAKNIKPPSSWTETKPLFGFVVDVLGLNTGHLVDLLKKRIDPKLVDKAQAWVGRFGRAWDWITDVIDTSKSPAQNTQGLMGKAKDFGKTVLTGAVEWVTGKVATELATLAAAAAASGGVSEVIDIARRVYKAMVTAKRWAGRILQMASDTLDHVLDIASGNVSKVGAEFEKLMGRGMPVVIGFLADQVGLGGVGTAIRNIVDKLRAEVDAAILWLIDKAKAGIEAVLGAVKSGVASVKGWFGIRERFTAPDNGAHQLYFVGSESAAKLVVASVETPVEELLATGGKLEAEIVAAKDDGRKEALKAARDAVRQLKMATAAAPPSNDAIELAVVNVKNSLALTGVATAGLAGVHIKPGDKITLLSKLHKEPTNTGEVQSIDFKTMTFNCMVAKAGSFLLTKQILDYGSAWRMFQEGDVEKPQCHHKIPWEKSNPNHHNHPLRQLSKVNLYSERANLMNVFGHRGGHSKGYHDEVHDRLYVAWRNLPAAHKLTHNDAAANKAAEDEAAVQLRKVMTGIGRDIKNGKLNLYTKGNEKITVGNPDHPCNPS